MRYGLTDQERQLYAEVGDLEQTISDMEVVMQEYERQGNPAIPRPANWLALLEHLRVSQGLKAA